MSYVGNTPFTAAFLTDTFSGNGSTVAFTMSVAPANTSSILVAVTGVTQDPSTYSVSGTTLTFSAAPPTGTSNISVRYLGIPASGVTTTAYRTQTEFTATAGQTTFSVPSYTVGFIDVYRNGLLLGSPDFTATNGTTVVLTNAASAGDFVETVSFYVSSVLNALPNTGGTLSGGLIVNGDLTTTGNTVLGDASTDTLNVGNGGLVKDASGNVGIGYTSMNTTIAVNGNALFGTGTWPTNDFGRSGSRFLNTSSTEDGYLVAVNMQSGVGTSRGGYIALGARATTGVDGATFATVGGIRENATSGNYSSALTFNTSTSAGVTTERARFNSTGALVLAGGSTTANGVGITFPATQSASTDVNTLDDYEEGTFTPTDGSGAGLTFSGVACTYTKVGNIVVCQGSITYPATGSGLQARLDGFPFVSAKSAGGFCMYSSNNQPFVMRNQSSSTNTFLTQVTAPATIVSNAGLSGASIQFTFILQT